MVEHMVPSCILSEFFNKVYKYLHWLYFKFFFQLWQVKDSYFKIKVNGTNHTVFFQDPDLGCLQFKSDIAHLVLVKLSSVCKDPLAF